MKSHKQKAQPIFVHSLFRARSTYFFNALRKVRQLTTFHEPFHEVLKHLGEDSGETLARTEDLKSKLRHQFLEGGYFDEYLPLLHIVRQYFKEEFSYQSFFLTKNANSPDLEAYIDALDRGSSERSVFQCTRTYGRIDWLRQRYPQSPQLFLYRNPWDQWYSYKVDPYISISPRLIFSQPGLPLVLQEVLSKTDFEPVQEANIQSLQDFYLENPVIPKTDYVLFFGLWVYAFAVGKVECDISLDMDRLNSGKRRSQDLRKLSKLVGLKSISFEHYKRHRILFKPDEKRFYMEVEDQVLEIFEGDSQYRQIVPEVREYLKKERALSFGTSTLRSRKLGGLLEDAARLRGSLLASIQERSMEISELRKSKEQLNVSMKIIKSIAVGEGERINNLADEQKYADQLGTAIEDFHSRTNELGKLIAEQITRVSALSDTVLLHAEEAKTLRREVAERDVTIYAQNVALQKSAQHAEEAKILRREVAEREVTINSQSVALQESTQIIGELRASVNALTARATQLDNTLLECDRVNGENKVTIENLIKRIAEKDAIVSQIQRSLSWRMTESLRKLHRIFMKPSDLQVSIPETSAGIAESHSKAYFTICSKNFIAHARVLHQSILQFYPEAKFYVVLCDRLDGMLDPKAERFEFIYLEDLQLPDLDAMAARYNITEFNTAIKPFAFTHLMGDLGFDSVVYLDPDILVVDRMTELEEAFANGSEAILTPHILKPAENDEVHDGKMLLFGIYNLGFLGLRKTPAVLDYLGWWGRRLEKDCVIRLDQGLFVDQKWADLLPAFVPGTKVLHHPGYNVAYWNLPQRQVEARGGKWIVNGIPLRFVHFSGNRLDDHNVFSRHSSQVTLESIGDLKKLLDYYREQVYAQGHKFYRSLPYAYSWNGESGLNLHTPDSLDIAKVTKIAPKIDETTRLENRKLNVARVKRALRVLFMAVRVARQRAGGWRPLAERALTVYRQGGIRGLKRKCIELSRIGIPPVRGEDSTIQPHTSGAPRILYLDWGLPKPDRDAGSVTAVQLMKILRSLGYEVTFLPCSLEYEENYYEALLGDGIKVICAPEVQSVKEWLQFNAAQYQVCILARGPVAWPYLDLLKQVAPLTRLIFNTVDLHYIRELRHAELLGDPNSRERALDTQLQELTLVRECDLTIVLSSEELYTIRENVPDAKLAVLPLIFSEFPGASKSFEERADIIFVGSFPHLPNIDAVLYFARSIFPLIQNVLPDVRFKIVGANPPPEIKQLEEANKNIEVLGYVKDLTQVFENAKLSVAPILFGAGIKGKIGTSLCYGVPCVATPIAAEGMGLTDEANVLIGATPESFATAVCRVYTNKDLWIQISNSGYQFAFNNYSVEVNSQRIGSMLDALRHSWQPMESVVELDGWAAWDSHRTRMRSEYVAREEREQVLLPADESGGFYINGFCCVCKRESRFLTSFMYAVGNAPNGRKMPNWREHLQCEQCGLVNRVRASLHALHMYANPNTHSRIYVTEEVTATYRWLREKYPHTSGSEYLGPQYSPGEMVGELHHEDVMNMSFEDRSFDRLLSFDVLEHVPNPKQALREIYRVLDDGGIFLFSVPFASESPTDIVRATLDTDGSVVHHLPPEYHGNPVDHENGALCFRYFGWQLLDELRELGFCRVRALTYWSELQGYLGREQYLFIAHKPLKSG